MTTASEPIPHTTSLAARQAIQRNDFENHAKAVAEGMQALSWVVVKPAPRDFIENFVGASDFWANKVRAGCVVCVCGL